MWGFLEPICGLLLGAIAAYLGLLEPIQGYWPLGLEVSCRLYDCYPLHGPSNLGPVWVHVSVVRKFGSEPKTEVRRKVQVLSK